MTLTRDFRKIFKSNSLIPVYDHSLIQSESTSLSSSLLNDDYIFEQQKQQFQQRGSDRDEVTAETSDVTAGGLDKVVTELSDKSKNNNGTNSNNSDGGSARDSTNKKKTNVDGGRDDGDQSYKSTDEEFLNNVTSQYSESEVIFESQSDKKIVREKFRRLRSDKKKEETSDVIGKSNHDMVERPNQQRQGDYHIAEKNKKVNKNIEVEEQHSNGINNDGNSQGRRLRSFTGQMNLHLPVPKDNVNKKTTIFKKTNGLQNSGNDASKKDKFVANSTDFWEFPADDDGLLSDNDVNPKGKKRGGAIKTKQPAKKRQKAGKFGKHVKPKRQQVSSKPKELEMSKKDQGMVPQIQVQQSQSQAAVNNQNNKHDKNKQVVISSSIDINHDDFYQNLKPNQGELIHGSEEPELDKAISTSSSEKLHGQIEPSDQIISTNNRDNDDDAITNSLIEELQGFEKQVNDQFIEIINDDKTLIAENNNNNTNNDKDLKAVSKTADKVIIEDSYQNVIYSTLTNMLNNAIERMKQIEDQLETKHNEMKLNLDNKFNKLIDIHKSKMTKFIKNTEKSIENMITSENELVDKFINKND